MKIFKRNKVSPLQFSLIVFANLDVNPIKNWVEVVDSATATVFSSISPQSIMGVSFNPQIQSSWFLFCWKYNSIPYNFGITLFLIRPLNPSKSHLSLWIYTQWLGHFCRLGSTHLMNSLSYSTCQVYSFSEVCYF